MQTLYTVSTLQTDVKPGEPQKLLQRHFDQSKDLLQYFIYFISEVAAYAEEDSYNRSSKHLPSTEDLNVNTKIAGNEVVVAYSRRSFIKRRMGTRQTRAAH